MLPQAELPCLPLEAGSTATDVMAELVQMADGCQRRKGRA